MAKVNNETRLVAQLLRARMLATTDAIVKSEGTPLSPRALGVLSGVKETLDALDRILAELETR